MQSFEAHDNDVKQALLLKEINGIIIAALNILKQTITWTQATS